MNTAPDTVLPALRRLLVEQVDVPIEAVDEYTPFTDLGLDSLSLVDFMFQVEDLFHIVIEHDDAMADPTLQGLATLVTRLQAQALGRAA